MNVGSPPCVWLRARCALFSKCNTHAHTSGKSSCSRSFVISSVFSDSMLSFAACSSAPIIGIKRRCPYRIAHSAAFSLIVVLPNPRGNKFSTRLPPCRIAICIRTIAPFWSSLNGFSPVVSGKYDNRNACRSVRQYSRRSGFAISGIGPTSISRFRSSADSMFCRLSPLCATLPAYARN